MESCQLPLQEARLILRNAFGFRPGTAFRLESGAGTEKAGIVSGNGTVSPDARGVVPHPGVFIYPVTGAMVSIRSAPGIVGRIAGGVEGRSDPVNIATGQFVYARD